MMLVLSKLDLVGFHFCSAVCKSWQSIAIAAMRLRQFHLQPQLPWVFLSFLAVESHIGLYSYSHGKIFRLELLDQANDAQCFGSNWGWLIMAGEMAYNFLLNLLTKKLIEVPPQSTLPDYPYPPGSLIRHNYIRKAIMSSSPVLDDYVVIAIYDKHCLAFCKPGDEMWLTFQTYNFDLEDIIFYDGKLYMPLLTNVILDLWS
ncbi:hypothetical protein NE237_001779 [Protea cynaroides]|uniref:KIB1-4 beta-propeller domain-containing protein n=1 Tax=Protea cynaroides TaxID=273540 RepID=A0A9Q0KTS1_9MAGN|nr:hypothetical protein NE237_001779 [Protea cynaroides]